MALPQQDRPDAAVATVYMDSPCGNAALDLAVRTAREESRPLLVIVPAKDRAEYEGKRKAIELGLRAEAKILRLRPAIGPDGQALKRALQQEEPQLLVLGCDLAGQLPPELAEFAALANCPVLVMRGSL
jgi:electron transfer flavoprotein alpha/beta subunit